MRKISKGSRFLSLLLVMAIVMTFLPISAFAAKGDLSNVSTGLDDNIDTADTISLPIKIYDYENDGMLFEYAEAYAGIKSSAATTSAAKTAKDFGATWAADFASMAAGATIENSLYGNFKWTDSTADVNKSIKSGNTYANYLHTEFQHKSTDDGGSRYGRATVITPNDLGGIAMNNARYLVMVYRSNVTSGKIGFWMERTGLTTRTNANNRTGDLNFTSEGATNWTYAVYDLKQGNLGNTWTSYGNANCVFVTLPIDASGEYMDIAHIALFANENQAKAFGEYALTDGSDRGDNRGFGLLRGSRTQSGGTNYAGIIAETDTVYQVPWTTSSTLDLSTVTNLGYQLLGIYGKSNIANIGLLESAIGANGYPVYKEEVVTYLANLLKHSLEITERNSDGWKNYRYVKGTASSIYGGTDLATALRSKINGTMGSYAEASSKNLVGTWAEVGGNIASYYDAAYFLLNSIFVAGSYNVPQDDYDYLVLSAGTDTQSGDKVYVFDGGFTINETGTSAVEYDLDKNTIQNSDASYKTQFSYSYSSSGGDSWTTLNPFLPITDRNTADGMTKNPYYQDDGVINGVKKQNGKDSLYQRNFNFAMVSEGEFVYHADDELFFEFEGDDDVYLFINNELVMDIGSAHSIDSVRFNVNDYVNAAKAGKLGSAARNEALALEEGNTYSFKFYYMERHSYGSNIRINTNIRVTDPSMTTAKTAWQDGTQLDFGSIVDKDKVVEYGFAITNNGEENLYNLTFTDNDIGVKLDPTNGLTVTGNRVYDVNGGSLEAKDLTAVVSHPDYTDINVTFADNNALKQFLKELTATGTEEGGGLYIGATVTIRGIGYKLTDAQIAAGVFDNTVLTTATNKTATKTLQGQASMRVFVPADPMYYQWADHNLSITKAKLIEDVLAAAKTSGNILEGKVPNLTTGNVNKIELVTKAGTAISSPYVTINSSYNLTVNYDTAGSHVFYVKITYNSSKNTVIVPVLVNVTDVQDSVYVLDYGLKVDLTGTNAKGVNELTKNDTLTVPGRTTNNSILGIGSSGAYSPNEITFTVDDDGTVEAAYGDFELNGQTLTFTPDAFLEGYSTTEVAVNVYESDITPSKIDGTLDINNEVEMYKSVITLPANVVYYEDDFPAITYTSDSDKDNVTNTIEHVGSSDGKTQSADQDEQYGHDGTYADATEDKYSAGSLTKITIKDSDTVASFTFTGTGFELIGRTNATDSATLIVKVLDSAGAAVKTIPVITEFDNQDNEGNEGIYQVPVIRVEDLAVGTYTVQISGVPAGIYDADGNRTDTKDTILYIDGLRIFQPIEGLTDENDVSLEKNYLETEQDAQFIELRDEIIQGKIAVAKYSDSAFTVSTSTSTWTENLSGEEEGSLDFNEVSSVEDYLIKGPNNEVYMTGTYDNAALVFYVKDTNGSDVSNLQIALRAIDESLFMSGIETAANATVRVGVYNNTNDAYAWTKVVEENTSSTEQYYVIDYTQGYYDTTKGAYQVVIRVDKGMVSYSSLKLTGLELVSVNGDSTDLYYVNGILSKYVENPDGTDDTNTVATASLEENNGIAVASVLAETTDDTATGEYVAVDASTYVNFQSVKEQMASNVLASDLEEPEVTEPEETEPEETEPEVTEPEETEPEETQPEETEPSQPAEDDDAQQGSSGDTRNEIIDALIGFLKRFWGF